MKLYYRLLHTPYYISIELIIKCINFLPVFNFLLDFLSYFYLVDIHVQKKVIKLFFVFKSLHKFRLSKIVYLYNVNFLSALFSPNRYVPTGHHTWVSTQHGKMSRQVPPTARPERDYNVDIDEPD